MDVHTYGNIVAKTKKHEMNEQGSEHKETESEHKEKGANKTKRGEQTKGRTKVNCVPLCFVCVRVCVGVCVCVCMCMRARYIYRILLDLEVVMLLL